MKKYRKYIAIVLSLIMLCGFSINSYASERDKLYNSLSDFASDAEGFLQNICGVVFPFGITPSEYYNGLDFDSWYLNNRLQQEHVHGGGGYERTIDYINANVSKDEEGNFVTTSDFNNTINNYANYYISQNPTGYSVQTIYSIDKISSTYFYSAEQYNSFINACKSCGSDIVFVVCTDNRYIASNVMNMKCFAYPDHKVDFYSRTGHINDYTYSVVWQPSYNWKTDFFYTFVGDYYYSVPNNGYQCVAVRANGDIYRNIQTIGDGSYADQSRAKSNFGNPQYTTNSNCIGIFSTTGSDMNVFLYDSIDAIKVHSTAQPNPYYVLPSYKGPNYVYTDNSVYSPSSIVNNSNLYNQITSGLESGMSADQLQITINNIIQTNNDSPVPTPPPSDDEGGGSDSGDSIWDKLFGGLGDLIGGIINGILNIIARIIDGITSIVDSITKAITMLLDNTFSEQGTIFQFLKLFFEWLPEPIPQLLTSLFVISVIFAVIKLIKGAF